MQVEREAGGVAVEPDLAAVRVEIATVCRGLSERGLVLGSAGNVSVKVLDRVVVTATGARFDDMTPDHVTVTDLDGTVVDGGFAPTSEIDLHLEIYRRFGSTAVVHTHSPNAVAVGLVTPELPCIHYQMLLLGGALRVASYATYGTAELAANVASALEGKAGALMAHHGAVTHAQSLSAAVEHSLLVEWACGIYATAAAMGTPLSLTPAQQESVMMRAIQTNYGVLHSSTKGET